MSDNDSLTLHQMSSFGSLSRVLLGALVVFLMVVVLPPMGMAQPVSGPVLGAPNPGIPAGVTPAPFLPFGQVGPAVPHPATGRSASTMVSEIICAGAGSSSGFCVPSPQSRTKPALVWDISDNATLLFGGLAVNGATLSDAWEWNGTGWGDLTGISLPSGSRGNTTMAWDTTDGYAVLFGGWKSTAGHYLSDTWRYKSHNFTLLAPASHPSARSGYSMVYVPLVSGHGGYVLLFGGNSGTNLFQSDTWKFVGGSWTNITGTVTGGPPGARAGSMMAYDSVDNYVVLFGGNTKTGLLNDSWKFDPTSGSAGAWSQLFANGSSTAGAGPKAMMDAGIAMDDGDGAIVMNGGGIGDWQTGTGESVVTYQQTYSFVGGVWTNRTTSLHTNSVAAGTTVPLPTFGQGFTYQPNSTNIIMDSGRSSSGVTNATFYIGTLVTGTVAPNKGEVLVNAPLTLWANVSVGVPPITYVWTLTAGCASANLSIITCSPSSAGFFTPSVFFTDNSGATGTATGQAIWVDAAATVSGALTLSGTKAVQVPSTFWAFDYRCAPETNTSCVNFVKASPVHWFRVAGSMEGYNATSGLEYSRFGGLSSVNWNWTNIKAFCALVTPCNTVAAIPTQNNDTGLAVADVKYVEVNYSYNPTYWSLGNEPQGWVHFNQGFSATPYPLPYNRLTNANGYQVGIVENRIATAVLAYNSNSNFVVIQSAQCGNVSMNTQSAFYANADGTAPVVACHAYPAGGRLTGTTWAWFLSPSTLSRTSTSLIAEKAGLKAQCGGCNLPVWVTEFAGALDSGTSANYLKNWPGAVADAANLVQFFQANMSQFEPFFVGCSSSVFSILTQTCGPTAVSQLYTNILDHMSYRYMTNVSYGGSMNGVYAMFGQNASRVGSSLVVVNANTSVSANVTLPAAAIGAGGVSITTGTSTGHLGVWTTTNYTKSGAPTSLVLAPMEMLLVNSLVGAPPAPTSLHFSGTPASPTVTLLWTNPVGGVSNTTIYGYTGDVQCTGTPYVIKVLGNVTTGTASAVLFDTYYSYAVTATNSSGESPQSNCIRFKTASGVPPAPTGMALTPTNATAMLATWTRAGSSVNITYVLVYLFNASCSGSLLHTYNISAATLFSITGLTTGATYAVHVAEANSTGLGTASNCATAMAQAPAPVPIGVYLGGGVFALLIAGVAVAVIGGGIGARHYSKSRSRGPGSHMRT